MRKLILVLAACCSNIILFAQVDVNPVADPDFLQRDFIVEPAQECAACREPATKITLATATSITVYSNNLLYYKQGITVSTSPLKLIRKINTELTYFEFTPESDDCFPCNKNSLTFGNFDNSTILNQVATGAGTHAISWAFTPPKTPGTLPAIFNITLPPSVKCCTGTIRWCVRFLVEFDDCTVCSKTICFEKKKSTTTPASIPSLNPTSQN